MGAPHRLVGAVRPGPGFVPLVREVYEIHGWHPAATTPSDTRPLRDVQIEGRWEFTGAVAPAVVRDRYVGRSVAHYFPGGAANPVTYVNA